MRMAWVGLLFGLAWALAPARADELFTAAQPYPTPATTWTLAADTPGFALVAAERDLAAPLHCEIRDGRTGRDVGGTTTRTGTTGDTATFTQRLALPSVRAEHRLTADGGAVNWRVTLANAGGDEVRLALDLVAPLALAGPLDYWDGHDLREAATGDLGRDEIEQTFPVSAVYDDSLGLAIGVRPDSLISHLASGFSAARVFRYGTRLSLLPGETATVEFVLFTFAPVSGHLDAIGGYQQRFPDSYEISDEVDPRLTRFGGDTLGYGRGAQREGAEPAVNAAKSRSGFGSWDWGYAPFRRCGDWLGRPELWDWDMGPVERERVEKRADGIWFDLRDQARFRETRRAGWRDIDLRHNTAMAFYLISWLEENLARQLDAERFVYPYGEAGPRLNWVTGTSFELHTFPWGTAYEETIRRDIPTLIEELALPGFALDIAGDKARYRGTTDRAVPGWAWDEEGRYIHAGVGQRLLLDYLRSQRRDGLRMGIVTNGGDPFMIATAADATINEAKDQPNLRWDQFRATRYQFGAKRIHLHSGGGFDNPGLLVDWRNLTPEQIRLYYQDHLHEWLLGCWQGGYTPSVMQVFGRESVTRDMPAMIDVQGRGYRPVPATRGNSLVARARYGQGLRSVLVLSNPTTDDLRSDETILADYLTAGAVLPIAYDGRPQPFTITAGTTSFPLELPRHRTALITVPLALALEGGALTGSGQSSAEVAADRLLWRVTLNLPEARSARLLAEAPPEFALADVAVNGAAGEPGQALQLTAGENRIEVTCRSLIFRGPEAALLAFPYPRSTIVLPAAPDERETAAATMLQDFVAFHDEATLPIAAAGDGPTIVIGTGDPGIRVDGRTLTIAGETPFETQQLTARLMRLLMDRRGFVPPFAETLPIQPTRDMLAKIGVDRVQPFAAVDTTGQEIPTELGGTQVSGLGVIRAPRAKPLHGSPLTAGFTATDRFYIWAVKAPMLVGFRSMSVYLNADNAPTGRVQVAEGADWRFQVDRGEAGAKLVRYLDIPAGADGRTITAQSKNYQVARYEGGAVSSGDGVYLLLDRRFLTALPPTAEHRFYVLAYGPDGEVARGTWLATAAGQPLNPVLDLSDPAEAPPAELTAPALGGEVTLDGKLDEQVWAEAATIDHLLPLRDGPLQQPTEAFVFFAADALYLGVRCWETQPEYLSVGRYERDADRVWSNADHLEIFLAPGVDSGAEEYPFYQLMVTPAGTQWDGYAMDVAWNGEWQSAAAVGDHAWTAELRVPYAALTGADAGTWRFNLARHRAIAREWSTWAPITSGLQKPRGFGVLRRE